MSPNEKKIGILIPLKARSASRNWNSTCARLADTLASLRIQTSRNYEAVVVGHNRPEQIAWDNHITFHTVDTPPPTLEVAKEFATDNRRFTLDKNRKIVRGMQILQDENIDYWFTLDADDLVHKEFVKTISAIDTTTGMLINDGYLIYLPHKRYTRCHNMVQLCGSTSVLCSQRFVVPSSLDEAAIKAVPWCRFAHMNMATYFEAESQSDFVIVTDPLVGYVLGHGDNCSDGYRVGMAARVKSLIRPWLLAKHMSAKMRSQFGMT